MTDLVALLKEARDDLHSWTTSELPVMGEFEVATLDLVKRIDLAIASLEAAPERKCGTCERGVPNSNNEQWCTRFEEWKRNSWFCADWQPKDPK